MHVYIKELVTGHVHGEDTVIRIQNGLFCVRARLLGQFKEAMKVFFQVYIQFSGIIPIITILMFIVMTVISFYGGNGVTIMFRQQKYYPSFLKNGLPMKRE